MLLIAIAWMYVVLMIALVEATSSNGTLLGAAVTVLLYGLLPLGIVGYLFLSPARRRARRAAEAAEMTALANSGEAGAVDVSSTGHPSAPDDGGHPAGDAVTTVRKEP